MLNDMEFAMLKARGYDPNIRFQITSDNRDVIATTHKGEFRAEALGRSRDDAARKLIAVVARR